eukprot:277241_1
MAAKKQYCCFDDMRNLLFKYNNGAMEEIEICRDLIKINRKNKRQKRIFVLTDKAIYNIKPEKSVIQRRIDLLDITSITLSSLSSEFTLNVPSEYDYRWDALDKSIQNDVQSSICEQMIALQHSFLVNEINTESTSQWTVTKKILKNLNSAPNKAFRTITAVDHLSNMGFKRNMAREALNRNNGDLSLTVQSLLQDVSIESEHRKPVRSPFQSNSFASVSVFGNKVINKPSPIVLLPSITTQLHEVFAL